MNQLNESEIANPNWAAIILIHKMQQKYYADPMIHKISTLYISNLNLLIKCILYIDTI